MGNHSIGINQNGEELADKLDFREHSIISSEDPTVLSSNGNCNIDLLICSNKIEPVFSNLDRSICRTVFRSSKPRTCINKHNQENKLLRYSNPSSKLRIDLDRMDWDWEGWCELAESSLEKDSIEFYNSSTQDQWRIIDRTINEATLIFSKCEKLSTHCQPYWTNDLTEASKALRIAKKS